MTFDEWWAGDAAEEHHGDEWDEIAARAAWDAALQKAASDVWAANAAEEKAVSKGSPEYTRQFRAASLVQRILADDPNSVSGD